MQVTKTRVLSRDSALYHLYQFPEIDHFLGVLPGAPFAYMD